MLASGPPWVFWTQVASTGSLPSSQSWRVSARLIFPEVVLGMLRAGTNTMVCGSMWPCRRIARARALASGRSRSSRTSATTTNTSSSSGSTEKAATQP